MNYREYDMVSSEIKQLESLLADIPSNRIIERMGLESRLKSAKKIFESIDKESIRHRAIITFRGQPVMGNHGIVAEFAAKATGAFSEAISAIAASLSDNLKYMGPIPNRERNQMLITGTAIGSFGFEFEIPKADEDSLFPGSSEAEVALEKMQELFNSSVTGNDDLLTELVEEIHPRAVVKAVEFLEVLKTNKAWCALSFKEKTFRFTDLEQIEIAMSKLDKDNITETEGIFQGELQGILPLRRTFEFKTSEEIITGKIGAEIKDPDVLNREYLHKPVSLNLRITQVGQGKPRYMLNDLTHIIN